MPFQWFNDGAAAWTETLCPGARARTLRSMPSFTAPERDDGVIALAIDATRVCRFFQGVDGQQPFHEHLEKLDKAPVFLNGDDQRIVFLAQVLFHELRRLPIHQLALGAISSAFGFGSFRRNLLELSMGIERRL